ncbi:hypothetical protein BDV18DRAFT_160567 [Aspergillus unguis]
MLARLFTLLALTASALATNVTFRHPIAKPAFQVELLGKLPYNVSLPGGGNTALIPNRGGTVSGIFNGEIIGDLTSAVETVLPSEEGEYSRWDNTLLFANAEDDRILASITGTITYANEALHAFGYATFQTTVPGLEWINYATFLVEWLAEFNTGTGTADIFQITTGGRIDGKPIDALLPPGKA